MIILELSERNNLWTAVLWVDNVEVFTIIADDPVVAAESMKKISSGPIDRFRVGPIEWVLEMFSKKPPHPSIYK